MQDEVKKMIAMIQTYIEKHLMEHLTLNKLALLANYSPYHLDRLFKQEMGMTLFTYIRKLRLTAAAKMLRDHDVKVIDTALDFVFDTHEGFTRAFAKEFGMTPSAYRKTSIPIPYFMPYILQPTNHQKESTMKPQFIFTQVMERPARKLIVKRAKTAKDYFEYVTEAGCDIWGILCSVKEALFEPAGYWLPSSMRNHQSEYVQGVEVPQDYCGKLPEGFEIIDLKPCLLMVFHSEPYEDADFQEAIGQAWEAIAMFCPDYYGYQWDPQMLRFQLEPRGDRGYIEARTIIKG